MYSVHIDLNLYSFGGETVTVWIFQDDRLIHHLEADKSLKLFTKDAHNLMMSIIMASSRIEETINGFVLAWERYVK
jgi:hypothetical protein